jgi:hypothetical protein
MIPNIIERFEHAEMKQDWRTQYRRYRTGRLKHQYWLWNRRKATALVDQYDYRILQNCQPGHTVFFSSAGYYLKDIWPEITVVEQFPVVQTFYPDSVYLKSRSQLAHQVAPIDNFAMVNNRSEMWCTVDGLTEHISSYVKAFNPGCRMFYSFRDTQMWVNRLTVDLEDHFLQWATSLDKLLDLKLVWHDIQFPKRVPDDLGNYDLSENPDTTNGNLKFWFVYKGLPWTVL